MKKILSWLMILCLVVGMVPVAASAAALPEETDGKITLTETITLDADVTISQDTVLDMAGQKIETNGFTIKVIDGASLTITGNGTIENNVVVQAGETNLRDLIDVEVGGSLVIENGTFNTKGAQILNIEGTATVLNGTFACTARHEEIEYIASKSLLKVDGENATLSIVDGIIDAYPEIDEEDSSQARFIYGIYAANGATVNLGGENSDGPEITSGYPVIGFNNMTSTPAQTVNIYGGSYQSSLGVGETQNDQPFNAVIYFSGAAEVNIYDGSFTGGGSKTRIFSIPYQNAGVNLNIDGGTFDASEAKNVFWSNGGIGSAYGDNKILITGGSFKSTAGNFANFNNSNSFDDFILGGTYTDNAGEKIDVSEYIPTNAELSQNEQGEIVFTDDAVASVNGIGYTTLQAAVDAAMELDGEDTPITIKLLKNTTGTGIKVESGSNLIFDFGGNTYTVNQGVGSSGTETNGMQLLKDSDITIRNGTLQGDGNTQLGILIQNYSNLTLEDIVLDGRTLADLTGSEYTLSNNNGEISLNAGTEIYSRSEADKAMDVCWAASYTDGARVTVNDGVKIHGDVELGLWNQTAYDNGQSVLTVNGGVIDGKLTIMVSGSSYESEEAAVDAVKTNVSICGGSFGGSVDRYIDSDTEANAKIISNGEHSYYSSLDVAQEEAEGNPSAVVIDLAETKPGEGTTYTIIFNYNDGKTPQSGKVYAADESVVLPNASRNGYTFLGWSDEAKSYKAGDTVTVTKDMIFTAQWSYNPPVVVPSNPTYTNTVSDTENGKVTVSPTSPKEDTTVTITATPDEGYKVGSVTVTDADGKAVAVSGRDGKYTFTQPEGKVTVTVTFVWDDPFTDVGSAWYTDAIQYVYENGLMAGTSATTFDPEMNLTRAMTAQILYNLEGKPEVTEDATFTDIDTAPDWSLDAIAWTQDTGVVAGMGENQFAPNLKVTREQFAQMMYNYAKYKKYDLTKTGDLTEFPDADTISDWAETAMSWTNGNGLINGHEDSGLIDPQGSTTRAQAASILMNFDLNVAK